MKASEKKDKMTGMKRFALFLFCLLINIGLLFSGTPGFDELADYLLKHNRELAAINRMITGRKEKALSGSSFEAPSTGLEFLSGPTAGSSLMFSISWMYPFPGKLSLLARSGREEVREAELLFEEKKVFLIAMLKKMLTEQYALSELIQAQEEIIEVMKSFLEKMEAEYAAGMAQQSNILTMRIELKKMENMLIMQLADQKEIGQKIRTLLSAEENYEIPALTGEEIRALFIPEEKLPGLTVAGNPELAALARSIEALSLMVSLMEREKYPDFMLSGKIGTMGDAGIMAGVNLPFLTKKTAANIRLMQAEKKEKELMYENMKIEMTNMLSAMLFLRQAKKEILANYEGYIFKTSTDEITLYEAGYRAGKNSFLDVLSADKRYIENKIEYSRILSDMAKILSEIEILSGTIR